MALTKITGQVINTATDVTVGVLTVTDTLAVGGTVSVGGTLTYEDVTNVDSVGLITARNGITINSGGVNVGGALTVTTSHSQVGIFTATVNGANVRLFDNDTESKFRTVDGNLQLHADVRDAMADSEIKFYIDSQVKGFISAGSSFSLGNDADTYISRADANTLAVTTGGSEAARIDSNGRLGIGTASANTPLHVHHSTTNGVALFESGDAFCNIIFQDSGSNDTNKPQLGVHGDDFRFVMHDGSDSNERVRIKSTGNIGIKTAVPRGQLHICQGGSGFDYGTTGNLIIENNSDPTIQLLSPNTHSGNIHFGDNGNGMVGRITYDHVHNAMRFFTSNNERVTIKSNGNLGIGTTSASDFLHVNVTAQSGQGILIQSKDTAYGQITFDSNKTSADQNLAKIVSKWNGTVIGELRFETGDDTTNKDDGFISFQTSNDGTLAERMRITESGQLCLGTNGNAASADNVLEIDSSGTSIIKLNNTDDGVAQLSLCNTGSSNGHIKQENGVMNFLIANTAYMYLNGADLGIGESSPDSRLHVNSGGTNTVATFESTDQYANIALKDSGTNATGTYFGIQNNDFRWITHDGSSSALRIRIKADGNLVSSSGGTSRIAFGSGDGTLYSGMGYYAGGNQDVGLSLYATTNAGVQFVEHFRMEHNGTLKGTDTSIGSLSDSRLKKDIADYSYDISKFKQFKPKSFNWINPEVHGDKSNVKGFLAQDIETVDGDWVEDSWISKDDPDFSLISDTTTTNGEGETVGVSKISKFGYKDAMYISVVQQLITRIETLEAEVSALKGG